MTARWCDGFDHYTTLEENYTTVGGNATKQISAGNGRRSSSSLRLLASSGTAWVDKLFDSQAGWTVGFGLRVAASPGFTGAPPFLGFWDSAVEHVRMTINTSGQIIATRAGTALGSPSSSGLTLGAYHYVEVQVVINDASGVVIVRLNGATVLNLTSQDTRNAGNASANLIRLGSNANFTATFDIDDYYVLDNAGSAPNNTFLGDSKVITLRPNGTGAVNQWTPSAGTAANSYQLLDEATPNADTDYISSGTIGQKTTVAYEDLPAASGALRFVQIATSGRKDDAGTRTICHVTRSGGADNAGPNVNLPDAYAFQTSIRETDPATGVAWTTGGVNAAEFGVEVVA